MSRSTTKRALGHVPPLIEWTATEEDAATAKEIYARLQEQGNQDLASLRDDIVTKAFAEAVRRLREAGEVITDAEVLSLAGTLCGCRYKEFVYAFGAVQPQTVLQEMHHDVVEDLRDRGGV